MKVSYSQCAVVEWETGRVGLMQWFEILFCKLSWYFLNSRSIIRSHAIITVSKSWWIIPTHDTVQPKFQPNDMKYLTETTWKDNKRAGGQAFEVSLSKRLSPFVPCPVMKAKLKANIMSFNKMKWIAWSLSTLPRSGYLLARASVFLRSSRSL